MRKKKGDYIIVQMTVEFTNNLSSFPYPSVDLFNVNKQSLSIESENKRIFRRVPQVIVHITEVTAVPIYVHAVPAPLHVTTKSTMPSPLTPPGPPLY